MSPAEVPQAEHAHLNLDPAATLAGFARHRRRFADLVASLDDVALATQSRCAQWSVADCLRHGVDVDGWMHAIWTGATLPFDRFNPNTTPHEFVLAGRSISDGQARDRYIASSLQVADDIEASTSDRWGDASFSPLGGVPWWMSATHVFYDSWMHERDIMLPLGMTPPVLQDEAVTVLSYSLTLAAQFVREPLEATIAGVRVVAGTKPTETTPVSPSTGDEIAPIVDALSGRDDLPLRLAGEDPSVIEALSGFERFLTTPS